MNPAGEPCFRTTVLPMPGGDPRGLMIADVDGDGHLDIVVADRDDDTAKIFWGAGTTFSAPQEEWVAPAFTLFGDRPVDVAIGDIGGDGRLDLVTANEMGDRICLLENIGDRNFRKHTFDVGNFPTGVELGDFDGAPGADIAVAFSNEQEVRTYRAPTFTTLARLQTIATFIPQSLSVGDLGGDGDLDLAWSAALIRDVSALPSVAVNSGAALSSRSVAGAEPQSLSVGLWRLDGTASATVIAGVYGAALPHLRVFGTTPVDVSTAKWPVYLAQTGTRAAYADNGGTFGVFQTGSGTLTDERLFTYDGDAQGLAAADLDGDGSIDLVISSPRRHAVLVFHGRGP